METIVEGKLQTYSLLTFRCTSSLFVALYIKIIVFRKNGVTSSIVLKLVVVDIQEKSPIVWHSMIQRWLFLNSMKNISWAPFVFAYLYHYLSRMANSILLIRHSINSPSILFHDYGKPVFLIASNCTINFTYFSHKTGKAVEYTSYDQIEMLMGRIRRYYKNSNDFYMENVSDFIIIMNGYMCIFRSLRMNWTIHSMITLGERSGYKHYFIVLKINSL